MKETIYTIPVNEAFEDNCDCPLCRLYKKVEADEIDKILGAAMMEPDIRIKTNKEGFCEKHFPMMFEGKNRLSLALMLESHLNLLNENIFKKGTGLTGKPDIKKQSDIILNQQNSCYICSRINYYMEKFCETICFLFRSEIAFQDKLKNQKMYCLNHYRQLLLTAKSKLSKNDFETFSKVIFETEKKYIAELCGDVSWFCKKFDYRYQNEPWKNSKDAIQRAIHTLTSEKID